MSIEAKLDKIIAKFKFLNEKMMDPNALSSQEYAKIAKEHSDMQDVVELAEEFKKAKQNLKDSEDMLKESSIDPEFKKVAEEDVFTCKKLIAEIEEKMKIALLPKDEADTKNAILEIRAGTGGEACSYTHLGVYKRHVHYHVLHLNALRRRPLRMNMSVKGQQLLCVRLNFHDFL